MIPPVCLWCCDVFSQDDMRALDARENVGSIEIFATAALLLLLLCCQGESVRIAPSCTLNLSILTLFWRKTQYQDNDDMEANCPGLTEEDHAD